jgi:nucleotide-binding universal stress UspA family protein
MRVKNIVCAVDFSDCSKAALETAADFAKEHGATLVLVHVNTPPASMYNGSVFNMADAAGDLETTTRLALTSWRQDAEAQGAPRVEIVVLLGSAWDEIVRLARTSAADLIVVGTHGRTGLERALIGSVAERVVRHAHCNVLVVRPPV